MKAKHLLFSSMFLSMGFAACTNEIEEFASQNQVEDYPGVELGKDFAISVNNADFSADAETRAAFEQVGTNWVAAWGNDAEGNPDALGAAWFNKFVYAEDGETVENPKDVYDALSEYGSNAKFVWQGGQIFQSEAISKLGAYVLYYPYNEGLTDNMQEIPVKKIPSTQTFDVKAQTAQVTENITAANVVVFGTSGDQAPAFTIKQIPNLYALSFYIADEALLSLANDIEITNVMLEVTDGSGNGLIYTDGIIKPSYTNITADTYNGVDAADPMPEIKFEGRGEKTDRMMINVINDGEEEYHITEIGKESITKPFFFSMLPVDKTGINKVSFKIIAKVGDRTKVFEKEVTDMSKSYISKMSKQGEVINLNVGLTHEGTIDGIYSVEQFVENWKAGETNFNLATALDLSELTKDQVDFEDVEEHVVFSGEKVTLPSINGKYTFNNDVEIKGNATITRCGTCSAEVEGAHPAFGFNKSAHITQNLTVNSTGTGALNINGATTVDGNLVAEAGVNFTGKTTISGTATIKKGAYFATASTIKGDVTVEGGKLTCKALTIEKNLTINEGAEVEVASDKFITVKGNVTANGDITGLSNSNVNIGGDLTANAPVVFANSTIGGNVTANEAANFGTATIKGNVEAEAEVEFTTATIKGNVTANADAQLGTATIEGNLIATGVDVTATKLTVGDITLADKATLTAPTLTAKIISLDLMSELTAATKFDVTEKLTAGGKVNAGEAAIEDLAIAYNVVVDLASAKVTKLDVNKTGTYFGTLNVVSDLEVKEGTNNGVINAATCTINGTFDQKATLNADITVAKDAEKNINGILNVNTDMTAANIINNGTVNVAAGKTLSGKVINNATINVAGKLIEIADGDFTTANTSYIKVENNGELAFVVDNTREEGIIEIMQSSKFKNINNSTVKFEWTATNVPNETAHKDAVDQVYINGAIYHDASQRVFFKEKDLYLNGNLTLDFDQSVSMFAKSAGKLVVEKNSTLKSTYPLTLKLNDNPYHEIKDGVTFKTENVTLDAETTATIKGGKGYTFDGQKTSKVTITQ